MADRSVTLFEVHLHDGLSFSASNTAPFRGLRRGDDEEDVEELDEAEEMEEELEEMEDDLEEMEEDIDEVRESSRSFGRLALLLGLVAVAAIVLRMRGGDGVEEMDDLDDLAEDIVDHDHDHDDEGEEAESEF